MGLTRCGTWNLSCREISPSLKGRIRCSMMAGVVHKSYTVQGGLTAPIILDCDALVDDIGSTKE